MSLFTTNQQGRVLGVLGLLLSARLIFPSEAVAQVVLGKPQRLTITPSMTITGQYDTNISQDRTDEIEDYSTTYSPAVSLTYRWPDTLLSANYLWNFEVFDDLEESDSFNESGSGSIDHVFNKYVTFFGGVSYSKSESEAVDLDLDVLGRLAQSARERQSSESISANALIQIGYLSRFPISLTYNYSDNLASAADEVDVTSHTFGANTSFFPFSEKPHSVSVTYTASLRQENRKTSRAPGDPALNFAANNFTDHGVNTSYTHRFDPTLSASGGGGVSWASHSSDPRLENELDPIYFASLTKRWSRTGVTLNYTLDTGRGGGFAGTTTSQTVGLIANHVPLPNLALGLNANYGDSNQENAATALDTNQESFLLNPTVSYNFLRYFDLTGSYLYSRISGDENFVDSIFQEFSAGLVLLLRPEWPEFSVNYTYSTNDSDDNNDNFDREVILFLVRYSFETGL